MEIYKMCKKCGIRCATASDLCDHANCNPKPEVTSLVVQKVTIVTQTDEKTFDLTVDDEKFLKSLRIASWYDLTPDDKRLLRSARIGGWGK